MPTNGFSIKPLKVKLFAGEQKATETGWVQVGNLPGSPGVSARNGLRFALLPGGALEVVPRQRVDFVLVIDT